ncbi:MAG: hypothetical protein GF347_03025 [Candidatus Moranbacteria bacterium]|nr:hypothetical protein [Candidatus Moranbacteria bacterium]
MFEPIEITNSTEAFGMILGWGGGAGGFCALVMFLYGGLDYYLAGGDHVKRTKALNYIFPSIGIFIFSVIISLIGFVILLKMGG